jgi:hypothetical protein
MVQRIGSPPEGRLEVAFFSATSAVRSFFGYKYIGGALGRAALPVAYPLAWLQHSPGDKRSQHRLHGQYLRSTSLMFEPRRCSRYDGTYMLAEYIWPRMERQGRRADMR